MHFCRLQYAIVEVKNAFLQLETQGDKRNEKSFKDTDIEDFHSDNSNHSLLKDPTCELVDQQVNMFHEASLETTSHDKIYQCFGDPWAAVVTQQAMYGKWISGPVLRLRLPLGIILFCGHLLSSESSKVQQGYITMEAETRIWRFGVGILEIIIFEYVLLWCQNKNNIHLKRFHKIHGTSSSWKQMECHLWTRDHHSRLCFHGPTERVLGLQFLGELTT